MSSPSVTSEELRCALDAFRKNATHGLLNTGRYQMRYFSWGDGPPVVFIHGMADSARAFAMVMRLLASRFTCVGYELPNGTTDGSRLAGYSLEHYASDALVLIDHLGFGNVSAVGSSFGSVIALSALISQPERFTCGILQNGFAYRPLNRYQRGLARAARYWPGWFADWPEVHAQTLKRLNRSLLTSVPGEVAEFFHQQSASTSIAAAAYRAIAIDRVDLRPQLASIRTPVQLLTGDQDQLVPRQCWDELERGLTRVGRVEIAGSGHYPQYTHPKEMAEAIASFLMH